MLNNSSTQEIVFLVSKIFLLLSQWIHRSCPQGKMPYFVLGAGENFSLENFLSSQKIHGNCWLYHFSSQHATFLFFLTFFMLENNLKCLHTNRQKKCLIFKAFLYWIFPGKRGAGENLTIIPGRQNTMDSLFYPYFYSLSILLFLFLSPFLSLFLSLLIYSSNFYDSQPFSFNLSLQLLDRKNRRQPIFGVLNVDIKSTINFNMKKCFFCF